MNFHSKIKEMILQEIYARLILYNFCEMVVSHAVVQTRGATKHPYKINFATAVNICKEYLEARRWRNREDAPDTETLDSDPSRSKVSLETPSKEE